jgi:hypothetical protein
MVGLAHLRRVAVLGSLPDAVTSTKAAVVFTNHGGGGRIPIMRNELRIPAVAKQS